MLNIKGTVLNPGVKLFKNVLPSVQEVVTQFILSYYIKWVLLSISLALSFHP